MSEKQGRFDGCWKALSWFVLGALAVPLAAAIWFIYDCWYYFAYQYR